MRRLLLVFVAAVLPLSFWACGSDDSADLPGSPGPTDSPDPTNSPGSSAEAYWPTAGWRAAEPGELGFDAGQLREIEESLAAELPFRDSLLVIRNGYVVHEQYFNGYDAEELHNIASVTKSWTSAAAGAASGRPDAPGLDEPLSSLLAVYFEGGKNADKAGITYRQLLEMRSGIEFSEEALDSGEYGTYADLAGQDLVAWGLARPVAYPPGEAWNYSTLDSQLVSAVLQESSGVSLEELVRESLFEPLGIADYSWFADASGTTIGGQQLHLTPRDMAKLGLLYLREGSWDGQQLIPSSWVAESTAPQGTNAVHAYTGQVEEIAWYGYHWWTWGPEWFGGYNGVQGKGYGGQQVLILPELDVIVLSTANTDGVDPARSLEQEAAIYTLLVERLLPSLTAVTWDFEP